MFRPMRRFKQQMTAEECTAVLSSGRRGVLAVLGDDGYPYGVPLNYWYSPENGKLYFHGAREGHKLDAVRNYDKVSFTVFDEGFYKEGDWAAWVHSVIVFGTVRIVEDEEEITEIARQIGLKYYPDAQEVVEILERTKGRIGAMEMSIEHMSGKLVHEK